MLNLMKRKNEESDKGSFIEHIGEILYRVFKRLGELLVALIKRVIKEVWKG